MSNCMKTYSAWKSLNECMTKRELLFNLSSALERKTHVVGWGESIL